MKMTQVDLYQVEIPALAKHTQKIYDITICRIQTDEGLEGSGRPGRADESGNYGPRT